MVPGFYQDRTIQSLAGSVSWSVSPSPPAGVAVSITGGHPAPLVGRWLNPRCPTPVPTT